MVNLYNYYTTLERERERAMKLTRYIKDTCLRVYDT
jgi:hypothetical protein